jgi:hypothetical protein
MKTLFNIGDIVYIIKTEKEEKIKKLKIYSIELKEETYNNVLLVYEIYNKGEFVITKCVGSAGSGPPRIIKAGCIMVAHDCYRTGNLFSNNSSSYKGDYNFTKYYGDYFYSSDENLLAKYLYNSKIKQLKKNIEEASNLILEYEKKITEINNLTNKN